LEKSFSFFHSDFKQERHCAQNITLWCIHITVVATEKQVLLHILSNNEAHSLAMEKQEVLRILSMCL